MNEQAEVYEKQLAALQKAAKLKNTQLVRV